MLLISKIMLKKAVFFLSLAVFSCETPQENLSKNYFDIKGLFLGEINKLSKEKPIINKSVEINGKKETKTISEIRWEKELDPFVQADINRAAYLGSYEITETDTTVRYLLKKEAKLPIYSIWILKKKGTNEVLNIDIASADENLLYNWQKAISANFVDGKLKTYAIKGSQKIWVFEEEKYSIIARRK